MQVTAELIGVGVAAFSAGIGGAAWFVKATVKSEISDLKEYWNGKYMRTELAQQRFSDMERRLENLEDLA